MKLSSAEVIKGMFTTPVFNMAAGSDEDVCTVLQQEFKTWQETTGNDYIFLLEVSAAMYVRHAQSVQNGVRRLLRRHSRRKMSPCLVRSQFQ